MVDINLDHFDIDRPVVASLIAVAGAETAFAISIDENVAILSVQASPKTDTANIHVEVFARGERGGEDWEKLLASGYISRTATTSTTEHVDSNEVFFIGNKSFDLVFQVRNHTGASVRVKLSRQTAKLKVKPIEKAISIG